MAAMAILLLLGALAALISAPVGALERAPEVRANGLFLAGYTKREDPAGAPTSRTGLYSQNIEVSVSARLDTAVRARVTLALPKDDDLKPVEAYVAAGLGERMQLTAGRFYARFGQHNTLHPHQYPFLDPPLVLERLFGVDGIDEVGLALRWPLPGAWTMTTHIANGDNPLWVNPTDEDLLYLSRLERRWQGGGASANGGGSWAVGRNVAERYTHALGADLRLQRGAWTWQTEYVYATEDFKTWRRKRRGLYSFIQHQLNPRWRLQARYDRYGLPEDSAQGWEDRVSVGFAQARGEALMVRFQYSRWRLERVDGGLNQVHFQLNFGLGGQR